MRIFFILTTLVNEKNLLEIIFGNFIRILALLKDYNNVVNIRRRGNFHYDHTLFTMLVHFCHTKQLYRDLASGGGAQILGIRADTDYGGCSKNSRRMPQYSEAMVFAPDLPFNFISSKFSEIKIRQIWLPGNKQEFIYIFFEPIQNDSNFVT